MDVFLYKDKETGMCPVRDLFLSKSKNKARMMACMNNIFNGVKGLSSKYIEQCRGDKCCDGKSIYEIRIQLPKDVLVRIFFVYFDNMAILFNWLEKRHKPDYGKTEANEVDRKYVERIGNTAMFYKKYLNNKDCLEKVNF